MAYLSNSENDLKEMLDAIGVDTFEDLIQNIPESLRFNKVFDIPEAQSEYGVNQIVQEYANKNKLFTSFLGGGAYDHYIPAVIGSIISRPEYYTSYTPYQPEVSQGNLQVMYEFQSMVCELTEMDVTNASMYEAGSALAEAILLAVNHTKNKKILLPETINPNYKKIVKTYASNMDIEVVTVSMNQFCMDKQDLAKKIDAEVGAIVVQHPNYFGFLEDIDFINERREGKKALLIQVYNPHSLGLLKTPGAFGVDIAVAEGQSLGNAQNYGGPYVGLFSANKKLVRKIPGRISGVTKDLDGKRGFVLTLQTREQHIRREKATSNICTNSGLMALVNGIYLAVMGKTGIRKLAELNLQKAHYLAEKLCEIPGVQLAGGAPFFNEFTLKLPCEAEMLIDKISETGILPGISMKSLGFPNHLLVAVTEKRTKSEMDKLVSGVAKWA
jgi:glycine dehydrogenase subunit 1